MKKALPIAAALLVLAAILVVVLLPKGGHEDHNMPEVATLLDNGDVLISTDALMEDTVSFITPNDNKKLELVAIKDEDGEAHVALGTCQSCNGAPGAYYNQVGDELQCNNCGLTFPLSILGEDGSGYHPILLKSSEYEKTDEGILVYAKTLKNREALFSKVDKTGSADGSDSMDEHHHDM